MWRIKYIRGGRVRRKDIRFGGDMESLSRKLGNMGIDVEDVISFRELRRCR